MIEVSVEAIASLTQYYDQLLRCFTFGDFQLVPTVEEFEEILGCLLGGRKPYLFSGFYPSMARISKVVKILAQEQNRVKQNRNGAVRIPRRHLEEKAKALADQGEWASFIDVLVLQVSSSFQMRMGQWTQRRLTPSLLITIARKVQRCEKSGVRIICCTPALYVWLVLHLFRHESRPVCPLQGHRICVDKGKANWEQLLEVWQGHPLIGSPDGRKEESGFCPYVRDVATYPSARERREAHGSVFQGRKMREVATNVYLRKTLEKPKVGL